MIGSKLSLICRVLIAIAVMSTVMLITFVGLAAWGWLHYRIPGVVAAALACSACWVSGLIAQSLPLLFRGPHQASHGVMLGMLFRMGLPLLIAVVLFQSRSALLQADCMGMLVTAYLTGLCVETLLSWWIAETSMGDCTSGMAKAS